MKGKFINRVSRGVVFALFPLFMSACAGGGGTTSAHFDGASYDISSSGDNSLSATINKTDNGYSISIAGSGRSKDYSSSRAPWYSIAPKVTSLTIGEGIAYAGEKLFSGLNLEYVILPSSLIEIGDDCFDEDVTLYTYAAEIKGEIANDIYYYSETSPKDAEKRYWHLLGGSPAVWVLETIKILFIGNSFTYYNDMPETVEQLASSMGYQLDVDSVTRGSTYLYQWTTTGHEAKSLLDTHFASPINYDYIIIQGQSKESYSDYDRFLSGATSLVDYLKEKSPNAIIRLYETWGFPEGVDETYTTIEVQEAEIRKRYENLSIALGEVGIHYVGKAFTDAYYNYPAASSGIHLYDADMRHPSDHGSYLSALVHLASIIKADIREATYIPEGFTYDASFSAETIAASLKEVAYHNVFE